MNGWVRFFNFFEIFYYFICCRFFNFFEIFFNFFEMFFNFFETKLYKALQGPFYSSFYSRSTTA